MTLRGSRRSGSWSWAKGASSAAGYLGPDRVRWRNMACGGLFCFQEQYCLLDIKLLSCTVYDVVNCRSEMKFYLLLYVLFSCNVLCTFYLNIKFSRKCSY
ncbi:hypothetical protein VPH35_001666 [Triticum aestivum]